MAEDESTLTVEVRLRLRPLVQADLAKDFVPLLEQLTVVGSIPSVPMLPLLPSPPSPPPLAPASPWMHPLLSVIHLFVHLFCCLPLF